MEQKLLTCANCGSQVPTGITADDDAIFMMTGSVTCPSCGTENDLANVTMARMKYAELAAWLSSPGVGDVPINNPEVDGPARAFATNWHNAILLVLLPAVGTFSEKLNQFAHDLVIVKKTGQLGMATDVTVTAQEMVDAIKAAQLSGNVSGIKDPADAAMAFETQATVEVKIRQGLLALLSSTLVASWTAFETLAGDLWEASVNARPSLSPKISPTISTDLLEKYRSNSSRKMGTIIREMDRDVFFTKLEAIRKAYGKTFREQAAEINGALESPALDALSLVRNLIVHKGGRCDEEYKRRAAKFPQLPVLDIDEPIMLIRPPKPPWEGRCAFVAKWERIAN